MAEKKFRRGPEGIEQHWLCTLLLLLLLEWTDTKCFFIGDRLMGNPMNDVIDQQGVSP